MGHKYKCSLGIVGMTFAAIIGMNATTNQENLKRKGETVNTLISNLILKALTAIDSHIGRILIVLIVSSEVLGCFRMYPVAFGMKVAIDIPKEMLRQYTIVKG